jgi:O-antigen ligase
VHNIFIEVLCELGIPMFALLMMLLYLTFVRGWRLFIEASSDPAPRATVATLLALTAYDLLIAQKEGQIWNHFVLYMHICLISRLYSLQAAGVGVPAPAEALEEPDGVLGHASR